MVTEAVLVEQRSSSNVNTTTYPITSFPRAIRYYLIERDISNQKPDYAVIRHDVGVEWVSIFKTFVCELRSNVYRLVQPIEVQVERYGNGYLVTDEDINRHGVGATIGDALRDYEEILLSYFESLSRPDRRLSHKLRQHLEFLRDRISQVQ